MNDNENIFNNSNDVNVDSTNVNNPADSSINNQIPEPVQNNNMQQSETDIQNNIVSDVSQTNSNNGYGYAQQTLDDNNTYQSVETKPEKKKKSKIIIVLLLLFIALIPITIFLILPKFGIDLFGGSSSKSITSNDVKNYNLEKSTIWVNEAIGITYDLPKRISASSINGSSSFSYLHGSSYGYYKGLNIYVEKSLENHTNLETLASDIIEEKLSDDYKTLYSFDSSLLKQFKNAKTSKIKIGDIDTIYFESESIDGTDVFGKDLDFKIIGYSFKYKENYISVYGELLVEEKSQLENLQHHMQYIINSIKPFDSSSLVDSEKSYYDYYDDGFTNNFDREDPRKFTINTYSPHVENTILGLRDTVKRIRKEWFEWDGTANNILNQLENKYKYANLDLDWYTSTYDSSQKQFVTMYDIISESKETIDGIEFNKYILKIQNNTEKTSCRILAVYFFIVDGNPYLLQYKLSDIYKDDYGFLDMPEKTQKNIVKLTEIVANTYIHTFRFLNENENYRDYVHLF